MVFGNQLRAALYRDKLQICEFRRRNKHKNVFSCATHQTTSGTEVTDRTKQALKTWMPRMRESSL